MGEDLSRMSLCGCCKGALHSWPVKVLEIIEIVLCRSGGGTLWSLDCCSLNS